ncbi:MAG: c-type cytochrome domain-containing protein, partial [Polyangiales bacterium]
AVTACLAEIEPDVGELRAGTCKPRDSDPTRDVSFKDNVLPLFQKAGNQGGCSCHQPSNRATPGIDQSGLNLENFRTLMQGGTNSRDTIVTPGDPCTSLIVQKVSSAPPTGQRMPPGGPPFMTPDQIAVLSDWIYEGARDN